MSRPTLKLNDGFDHTTPHLRPFVKELQLMLRRENFSVDTDGKFDTDTEIAVRNFQWENDLDDDGIVGSGTWQVLLGNTSGGTGGGTGGGGTGGGTGGGSSAGKFATTYPRNDPTLLRDLQEANKYKRFAETSADKFKFEPALVAGIGSRESRWGLSLTPNGPSGTGDFSRRNGSLPPDGRGWGRGLMQIDYQFHEFARGNRWQQPAEIIQYAVGLLDQNWRRFERDAPQLSDRDLLRATIAAYNAGAGTILNNIRNGRDIDSGTAHGNYSRDTISRAGWFQLHGWR